LAKLEVAKDGGRGEETEFRRIDKVIVFLIKYVERIDCIIYNIKSLSYFISFSITLLSHPSLHLSLLTHPFLLHMGLPLHVHPAAFLQTPHQAD
jgi:hypothetical protein